MTVRPKISLIVYGSILNPNDLHELFDKVTNRLSPIRVSGFKRIFNQEASWRETNNEEKAVLNVVRSSDSWFNGILISDLSESELRKIRERERGYRFTVVEEELIEHYEKSVLDTDAITEMPATTENELILTTTGQKVDNSIKPIPDYVNLCKDGAKNWGTKFYNDFMETTETNTGRTLKEQSEQE